MSRNFDRWLELIVKRRKVSNLDLIVWNILLNLTHVDVKDIDSMCCGEEHMFPMSYGFSCGKCHKDFGFHKMEIDVKENVVLSIPYYKMVDSLALKEYSSWLGRETYLKVLE